MSSNDMRAARNAMVDSQVRTDDVTDPVLTAAMRAVPREDFVPQALASVAYMGEAVEVAPGRFLLDPRAFAKLTQLSGLKAGETVLDVGGATGYSAAVFAALGARVTALESDPALAEAAKARAGAGIEVVTGALAAGYAQKAPFDVIFLNGAIPARPDALLEQLAPGGRLVGIVTDRGVGKAHIFLKSVGGHSSRIAFDAAAPALPGFEPVPSFVF
ncbi:MAG: protein-L-isoaspartate O-methyltransferase [Micropepsaceae bacterium]